ncbi:fumarylacetoacetate hydrolase family protein [Phenylobacterium sp. LjRoot219]|uniref:fumarylacetoacetate hydrolase family protein n=1 Tax=Phenylobacterium sp. LjRoot219 TaxID=3342283 RepID=UPI003ECF8101
MKFVRFGPPGQEKPGLIDAAGAVRDLSGQVPDISGDVLSAAGLVRLAAIDPQTLPLVAEPVRFGPPVADTRQFIAIGLNFADHAAETGQAAPSEPIIFTKAVSCIQGPDDDVRKPRLSTKMDWEVELGIVIGARASYVAKDQAMDYVAGFCVVDDLSERQFQMERGPTWDRGKGCETFGPVGPWLVTKDEIADVQNLDMWLDVNGKRMQTGNTKTMIFDCATIVSYLSEFMVLLPGDIITTGTPPGVGMGMNPQVWLNEGDVVELGIEKLGRQRHKVIAWNEGR